MSSDQIKKTLVHITEGIRDDVYKFESYYLLIKTIGKNVTSINNDPNKNTLFFGTIQRGLSEACLLAVSRLYDKSTKRNKTRSMDGLLNFLSDHLKELPAIVDEYNFKQQLKIERIPIEYIYEINSKEEINRRLLNYLKNDLINTYDSHQKLKTIRDKKLSHNDYDEILTIKGPFWAELIELVELAKSFLGIIGWAYLNVVYKIDNRYNLSADAQRPSIALERLLKQLDL